jgi:hypothetical protein
MIHPLYALFGSRISQTAMPAPTNAAMINTTTNTREEAGLEADRSISSIAGVAESCSGVEVIGSVDVGMAVSVNRGVAVISDMYGAGWVAAFNTSKSCP